MLLASQEITYELLPLREVRDSPPHSHLPTHTSCHVIYMSSALHPPIHLPLPPFPSSVLATVTALHQCQPSALIPSLSLGATGERALTRAPVRQPARLQRLRD